MPIVTLRAWPRVSRRAGSSASIATNAVPVIARTYSRRAWSAADRAPASSALELPGDVHEQLEVAELAGDPLDGAIVGQLKPARRPGLRQRVQVGQDQRQALTQRDVVQQLVHHLARA